jgi:ADP-ribose pyrophosphatase YjhB (NUDIX family)
VASRQDRRIDSDVGLSGKDAIRFRHEALAVVFRVGEMHLEVMLWKRAIGPFAGHWALPGGDLSDSERLGSSLARHLATKVDLTDVGFLEQLETRSDVNRDPRERFIATAYLALIATDANRSLPSDTKWIRVDALTDLAFDHGSIIYSARERLRAKLTYTNVAFGLAPLTFTIADLKGIYAAALGYDISSTNLQRVLLRRKIIEPTSNTASALPSGGRPARLYRFRDRSLRVTNPFAAFRPPPE